MPSASSKPCAILHRVLSGHAVGDEEDLVGLDRLLEARELVHHLVVDLQPAGGVDDHDAVARAACLLDAALRDLHDVRSSSRSA